MKNIPILFFLSKSLKLLHGKKKKREEREGVEEKRGSRKIN